MICSLWFRKRLQNLSESARSTHRFRNRRSNMRTSLLTIVLCLSIGMALAQTGGSITGEVKDQTGAVAPSAAVTVTNSQTNVARAPTTNSAGTYSFPDLD